MAEVTIYWNEFSENKLGDDKVTHLNQLLLPDFQLDLNRSKKPQQLSFFAKMLLNDILERDFEIVNALNSFRKDEHGKPSIQEDLHFNISHSENLIAIAICTKAEIGIDMQKEKSFSERVLPKVLNIDEQQEYDKSNRKESLFFDIWSKKEACVKATGKGIKTGLTSFSVLDSIVPLDNHQLHLQSINIKKGFSSAIAVNYPISNIIIKKLD